MASTTTSSEKNDSGSDTCKVQIALFAPTIEQVKLKADFVQSEKAILQKGEDGWHRVDLNLDDGDYTYQFELQSKSWFFEGDDKQVTINDPCATLYDKSSNQSLLRVRNGQRVTDDYQWQHDDVPLKPNHQTTIYELHVGDFSGGESESDHQGNGKFADVINKLDYLEKLGITAIELLPITAFPGDHSWGYTPISHYALDPVYGDSTDFKQLVDQAHGRGIRVILDMVLNHSHTEHPLAHIDHDYWFHHEPSDKDNAWGPQFNYEHHDEALGVSPALEYILGAIRHWVGEYHIDGIRYDAAKQIGNVDVMRSFSDTARHTAGDKHFLNAAEYLPPDASIVNDGAMDATWYDIFWSTLHQTLLPESQTDMQALEHAIDPSRAGYQDCAQIVNYTANHDKKRLFQTLAEDNQTFEGPAFGRAHLAASLMMTACGMPMIWMGEEFGEYKPFTPQPTPIDWELLAGDPNQNLHNHYCRLIQLRNENASLQGNLIEFIQEDDQTNILAYRRWTDEGDHVVTIANLQDTPHQGYTVNNLPCDGKWLDWIADCEIQITDGQWTVDLEGLQAKILVKIAD